MYYLFEFHPLNFNKLIIIYYFLEVDILNLSENYHFLLKRQSDCLIIFC